MASRRRSRQRALQILYSWDARRPLVDEAIHSYYDTLYSEECREQPQPDAFMERLVRGAIDRIAQLDEMIARHAEHWRLERMPAVDRNILRLAAYEILYAGTPAPVAIDEALELARRFSNEESVHFVNGVLDAIHREAQSRQTRSGGGA